MNWKGNREEVSNYEVYKVDAMGTRDVWGDKDIRATGFPQRPTSLPDKAQGVTSRPSTPLRAKESMPLVPYKTRGGGGLGLGRTMGDGGAPMAGSWPRGMNLQGPHCAPCAPCAWTAVPIGQRHCYRYRGCRGPPRDRPCKFFYTERHKGERERKPRAREAVSPTVPSYSTSQPAESRVSPRRPANLPKLF